MTEEVTITVPHRLYQRPERLAELKDQSLVDVLDEAVSLVEQRLTEVEDEDKQMAREEAAYREMHAFLMKNFAEHYVAIHAGQLVDHDKDELVLLRRIDEKYPEDVVLLKQVRPLPESPLFFRSPRFVRDCLP